MKNKLILVLLLLPLSLMAQEMSDGTDAPQVEKIITLWQSLIPLVVPLIIFGLRNMIPKLPSKWTPILAPLIGALIDVLLNFADLGDGKGMVGAVLGTAGIGVREVYNQARKPSHMETK